MNRRISRIAKAISPRIAAATPGPAEQVDEKNPTGLCNSKTPNSRPGTTRSTHQAKREAKRSPVVKHSSCDLQRPM
ncbi:hypothetical protein ON010_g801 [Phytophthora cinnamomi]|nr:hypothetical protein ON010_g801 [Phytophthora cinnamomi]